MRLICLEKSKYDSKTIGNELRSCLTCFTARLAVNEPRKFRGQNTHSDTTQINIVEAGSIETSRKQTQKTRDFL